MFDNTISSEQSNQEIVKGIIKNISSEEASQEEIKKILSLIDLTSLEGKDTPLVIKSLCTKAMNYGVAAVCVYPTLVKTAKQHLSSSSVHCACVAGGFPAGQTSLKIKTEEVKFAIEEGAQEIDFVLSRNLFLQEAYKAVFDEIAAVKGLCKDITLKIILETGELVTLSNIKKASDIAIQAGADFIKTSTGKIALNATPEAVCTMLQSIQEHYKKTGQKVGIKPSGGIADIQTAVKYLRLTQQMLDDSWLTKELFRFGASRLADVIAGAMPSTGGTNKNRY